MLEIVEGDRPRERSARRCSDDITDWCGYPTGIVQEKVEKNHWP